MFLFVHATGVHEGFVVFNADGIYLATYVSLLLNFELTRRGYYPSCSGFVSIGEVSPEHTSFISFESFNRIKSMTKNSHSIPG